MMMSCKKVRPRLLSYIDGDLRVKTHAAIEKHLENCPICAGQAETLFRFWKPEVFERVKPSALQWNGLSQRITEYENRRTRFTRIFEAAPRFAGAAAVAVIFLACVVLGVYLGGSSGSVRGAYVSQTGTVDGMFVESSYLDNFNALPAQSLGGVYTSMPLNEG
jgi:predicted anti-sigma-YlaC factor YlaD